MVKNKKKVRFMLDDEILESAPPTSRKHLSPLPPIQLRHVKDLPAAAESSRSLGSKTPRGSSCVPQAYVKVQTDRLQRLTKTIQQETTFKSSTALSLTKSSSMPARVGLAIMKSPSGNGNRTYEKTPRVVEPQRPSSS
eukprot:TRINITY_DN8980_c0_g1_i1.p1 TRINITY_DN8980_c0_g1~~TRINITY_DN8980_c0_g1_i1.p1  ORF type:complete len:138 (+),score=14.27 TRINITY_DN8980_c0_g1_i1:72-485(+)